MIATPTKRITSIATSTAMTKKQIAILKVFCKPTFWPFQVDEIKLSWLVLMDIHCLPCMFGEETTIKLSQMWRGQQIYQKNQILW